MVYFTSDLHLGHRNVLKLCNRPFSSIEEMDEIIIDNWNKKVHRDDTVYIMGNLPYRNRILSFKPMITKSELRTILAPQFTFLFTKK